MLEDVVERAAYIQFWKVPPRGKCRGGSVSVAIRPAIYKVGSRCWNR